MNSPSTFAVRPRQSGKRGLTRHSGPTPRTPHRFHSPAQNTNGTDGFAMLEGGGRAGHSSCASDDRLEFLREPLRCDKPAKFSLLLYPQKFCQLPSYGLLVFAGATAPAPTMEMTGPTTSVFGENSSCNKAHTKAKWLLLQGPTGLPSRKPNSQPANM